MDKKIVLSNLSSKSTIETIVGINPDHLEEAFKKMPTTFEEFVQKGFWMDGWTVGHIKNITLYCAKYSPVY